MIYHCGSSQCQFLLTIFFTGSFSPQVFIRHLTGDTWRRKRTTGASTWSVKLWKVRGVIWHIILWCTWKLSQTTCQSIFSVNVFFVLYHIFKQWRFLFRFCSIFLFPYIFLISLSNHFEAVDFPVFAQSRRWEKGWKLHSFSSHMAFIAFKFYTDQTEVVLLNGVESFLIG